MIGGWKLSGIISVVSGTPFTVTANGSPLNTPGTILTATITGSMHKLKGIGPNHPWFDPSSFSQPAGCTGQNPCTSPAIGNTGRNQFNGPGYIQDNFSIFKRFPMFRESSGIEVRLDAFQLSNTPQFVITTASPPNVSLTSSTFGTVTNTLGSGQGSVNGVGGGRSLQGSLRFDF